MSLRNFFLAEFDVPEFFPAVLIVAQADLVLWVEPLQKYSSNPEYGVYK